MQSAPLFSSFYVRTEELPAQYLCYHRGVFYFRAAKILFISCALKFLRIFFIILAEIFFMGRLSFLRPTFLFLETLHTEQFITSGGLETLQTEQFITSGCLETLQTEQFIMSGGLETIQTEQFITFGCLETLQTVQNIRSGDVETLQMCRNVMFTPVLHQQKQIFLRFISFYL